MNATMVFQDQGLVLGAGTVLAKAETDGDRRSMRLEGRETRLLTLLSAARGKLVGPEVLGHLYRGVKRWNEGDGAGAAIHLALTRLDKLERPHAGAHRLFLADVLLEAGAEPAWVLRALGLDVPDWAQASFKFYNPQQPRVPAGNGRISGQWSRIGGLLFQNASRATLEFFAHAALRSPVAAVVLGVLLIPTNKTSPEEKHDVPGHPGLRYERLIGERLWRIAYTGDDGEEHTILQETDGALRDPRGRVVGRVLPGGHVAIDLAAVAPKHLDDDGLRYCPAPSPDKYGQGMDSIARDYEDQVKRFVNPEAPTPRGLGFVLTNPMARDASVTFDDCQHSTSDMIEAKGPTFTDMLRRAEGIFDDSVDEKLLDQGLRQIQAAGARRVRWYFADQYAADHVRDLFDKFRDGREKIEIDVLPYSGRRK